MFTASCCIVPYLKTKNKHMVRGMLVPLPSSATTLTLDTVACHTRSVNATCLRLKQAEEYYFLMFKNEINSICKF